SAGGVTGRALAASSARAAAGAGDSRPFPSDLPGSGSNISMTGGVSAACRDAREREGFGAETGAGGAASFASATSTAGDGASMAALPFAAASGSAGLGDPWARVSPTLRARDEGAGGGTARAADGAAALGEDAGSAVPRRRTGAEGDASGTACACEGEAEGTARALATSMSRPGVEGRGPGAEGRGATSWPDSWAPA